MVDRAALQVSVVLLAITGLSLCAIGKLARVQLLPQRDRETEQALLDRGPMHWALRNGALLGLAFPSRLGTWLWYVVPVGALATADPLAGALAYGLYGFVRLATPSLLAGMAVRYPHREMAEEVLRRRSGAVGLADLAFMAIALGVVVAPW